MRKYLALNALLFPLFFLTQIKVTQEKKDETVTAQLDETINMHKYKTASRFLGMIGEEIYVYPIKENCEFKENFEYYYIASEDTKINKQKYKKGDRIKYPPEKLYGKNFLVVDVKFYNPNNSIELKEVSPSDWTNLIRFKDLAERVILYLQNKENNEMLYLDLGTLNISNDSFATVPYLEYLKNKYDGKIFIPSEYDNFLMQEVKEEDKYMADVSLRFSEKPSHCKPDITVSFKNNIGEEKLVFVDNRYMERSLYEWKLFSEYEDKRIDEKKNEDDEKKYIEERKVKIREKYKNQSTADLIILGGVWVGMTREQLIDSKGKPYEVNRTETKNSYIEQFVYKERFLGDYKYVFIYVENDKVTAIQD